MSAQALGIAKGKDERPIPNNRLTRPKRQRGNRVSGHPLDGVRVAVGDPQLALHVIIPFSRGPMACSHGAVQSRSSRHTRAPPRVSRCIQHHCLCNTRRDCPRIKCGAGCDKRGNDGILTKQMANVNTPLGEKLCHLPILTNSMYSLVSSPYRPLTRIRPPPMKLPTCQKVPSGISNTASPIASSLTSLTSCIGIPDRSIILPTLMCRRGARLAYSLSMPDDHLLFFSYPLAIFDRCFSILPISSFSSGCLPKWISRPE